MDVFPDLFVRVQAWYGPDGVAELLTALDPTVSWVDAAGSAQGRAATVEHLRRSWRSEELRPDGLHVLPDGLVVVDVHRTVRDERGAVRAEGDEQHRFRISAGGEIVEFRAGR